MTEDVSDKKMVHNCVSIRDDITTNYHGGDPESAAANVLTNKERDRKRILEHLAGCGPSGDTCDHIEMVLGISHQTCSARCSDLKRDGLVVRKPTADYLDYVRVPTRTGALAAVLVLKRFACTKEPSGQICFM